MDPYLLILSLLGIILTGAVWLPRALERFPLSYPIVYIAFGYLIFALPLGLGAPDPLAAPGLTEKLTELVVILALTGAGLKLDTPLGWRRWQVPWRLLGITMPLCIAAVALFGWTWLGLVPASALLLGAALAPTDPVLASEVQVGKPNEGDENSVRFGLTAEAGLNDGLAFPFTYLAILMATLGAAPANWLGQWLLFYLLYKVAMGVLIGWLLGRFLTLIVFRLPAETYLAKTGDGLLALAMTFLAYGVTELMQGYGFLAVFIAAVVLRHQEREAEYHAKLHAFAEQLERLLLVVLLVLLGGALQGGLLGSLEHSDVLFALLFLLLIRPLTGMLALLGSRTRLHERWLISAFGIRGIGSFYYLAYALNQANFPEAERLWAIVGLVVLVSAVVHGSLATPLMNRLEAEPNPEDGAMELEPSRS